MIMSSVKGNMKCNQILAQLSFAHDAGLFEFCAFSFLIQCQESECPLHRACSTAWNNL
jgi:hypothetical protein